jgi:C_GCAxxG_C_C family probable redox protein
MSNTEEAVRLMKEGCACSQAILAAFGEPLGLPRETALHIAAGFAGGMRRGDTCGAVTGAYMVLGLRHATENCDKSAGRADTYARVQEFTQRFRSLNGSVDCRDLLGCDISTPEGMKNALELNLFKTRCVKVVEDAATILEDMGRTG